MQATELESKYWREVLQRIIDVIVFLSKRGLALRGHDEIIGSCHNGNFLGIIKLLSKVYGNKGRGSTSYLSHSICD